MILKNNPLVDPPLNISSVFNKSLSSQTGGFIKITHSNRSLSLSQWSKELHIPLATLRYRLLAGWTDEEILGFRQHGRDRTLEQLPQASARANVLILDAQGAVISRQAAAALLRVQPRSLAQRLRRWAVPGKQTSVSIDTLFVGSRLETLKTLTDGGG